MSNPYVNKVIVNGSAIIDLTSDDVTASDVLSGVAFHLPSGAAGVGSCTYDSNTTDANATASEILATKTAYVNKTKLTGSMPNRGAVTLDIDDLTAVTIPNGYHDGSGKAQVSSTEAAKFISSNIRKDVVLLGVTGSMTGTEDVVSTTGTVTPNFTTQTKVPTDFDQDANYISQFTVNPIPVSYVDNSAGGQTCTIG